MFIFDSNILIIILEIHFLHFRSSSSSLFTSASIDSSGSALFRCDCTRHECRARVERKTCEKSDESALFVAKSVLRSRGNGFEECNCCARCLITRDLFQRCARGEGKEERAHFELRCRQGLLCDRNSGVCVLAREKRAAAEEAFGHRFVINVERAVINGGNGNSQNQNIGETFIINRNN